MHVYIAVYQKAKKRLLLLFSSNFPSLVSGEDTELTPEVKAHRWLGEAVLPPVDTRGTDKAGLSTNHQVVL